MTEVFRYVIFPTAIAILLCVLAILFNVWMCKIGVSRDSYKLIIIIGTFFFAFLKQPVYKDISWWMYGTILILGTTLAVHRSDLGETMKYGKWWWVTEEKKKKIHSNSK